LADDAVVVFDGDLTVGHGVENRKGVRMAE
jgi:hypothetical protein